MAYTRFDWEREIGDCGELSSNAHHVALTLGNWIHSHLLTGFATQEEIARRMKRSRKHLNRGLSELEREGWLQRESGAPGRATVYRAVIPAERLASAATREDPKQMARDFVHELSRQLGHQWWNDPDYVKKVAPLLAIVEADLRSGLLVNRRASAMEWCLRPLPAEVKTLSGLLYSRYVEWRQGFLDV